MSSNINYCTNISKRLLKDKYRLVPFIHGEFVVSSSTSTSTTTSSSLASKNTNTNINNENNGIIEQQQQQRQLHVLRNPATNGIVHDYYNTTPTLISKAIDSCVDAYELWSKGYSPSQRSKILLETSYILKEKSELIANLETLDTGRPIVETTSCDVNSAIDCIQYYAGLTLTLGGQTIDMPSGHNNWAYTRRESIGVIGGIGAWNYPLQSAAWKVGPALAFGNAMIYKPSELTPLTTLLLAESLMEAGLPDGVFNVVLGDGPNVGQQLISSRQISKVAFTGSYSTGQLIYENAAKIFQKPPTMELGGKSPIIIFDDVVCGNGSGQTTLDDAVSGVMMGNWYSSGQVCSNGTRVFVHESIHDEFVTKLIKRTSKLKLGNPFDVQTEIGPMISLDHKNNVKKYIQTGIDDDQATLVHGGTTMTPKVEGGSDSNSDDNDDDGYYMMPTIFTNCHDDMTIVKDEIFGMVCCVLKFTTEEEVIERANSTQYGLSAGVFTNDLSRAHRVISKLDAGTTWINNYNLAPVELPWGGYKKSGIGYENGLAGADAYTQFKSVYVEMDGIDCPYE